MVDRKSLRLSATLLFVGLLLTIITIIPHPVKGPGNDHTAVFAEYARSGNWTAIHLGEFASTMIVVAGLIVLFFALNVSSGIPGWVARFAAVSAVVSLALFGVLQAVDGVALKQAVDAWVSAPSAEKAARFASAESIRWLEWGVHSYWQFMWGLSFVLFATVIVWTARIPRPIGYLMGLQGLAIIAQGWVVGLEGFSATLSVPVILDDISGLGWIIWLLIIAWRMKEAVEAPAG
ncbi:Uncharacterised protein [uncultured archaeon]|nr:Uncharacterised protein [uncultured archaeon]